MRVSRSLPVLIVFDNGPAPSVVSKEIQEGPNGGPREEERSKPVAERLVALAVPEKRCLRGIFSALGIDDHVAARAEQGPTARGHPAIVAAIKASTRALAVRRAISLTLVNARNSDLAKPIITQCAVRFRVSGWPTLEIMSIGCSLPT